MIFDTDEVELLYEEYQEGQDVLDDIITFSTPLMEVIAMSVCPPMAEDLVQEGHLKLMNIVTCDQYRPERGSLYSFLSMAIKNHMIDVLRRQGNEYEEDCDEYASTSDTTLLPCVVDGDCIVQYNVARYSYHSSVVQDASTYVLSSATENICEGSRGVIRTLSLLWPMNRAVARTLYFGTVAVARLSVLDMNWQCNIKDAINLAKAGAEASLLPELVLMLGLEQVRSISRVFSGSYIKL